MPLRTQVGGAAHELWSDGRGWILVVISAGQLLSLGVRLVFPALLPQIKAEFLLTNATAGALLSLLWVSYATAQLPGGVLTDWVGERRSLITSGTLAAVSIAVIVLSPGLALFVVGLLAFGVSTGLYATPRITVLSDVYPERAGTAIGVNAAAGNFGNAVIPLIATVVTGVFAWRVGVGVALPWFVLLVVGFQLVVPFRTSSRLERDGDGSWARTARRVLDASTTRPVVLATGTMVLVGFVWQGFTSFLPTYLVEVKGIPQTTATAALAAFFVTGALVQPVTGSVVDRYDERRVLVVVTAVTAVSLAGYPFTGSVPALVVLSAVAGVQLAFWPIIFAYVPKALPDDIQGSSFGLLRTAFLYLGATGPVVVGTLADVGRFDEAFLLFSGIAVVAMGVSSALPRVDR